MLMVSSMAVKRSIPKRASFRIGKSSSITLSIGNSSMMMTFSYGKVLSDDLYVKNLFI